MCVFLLKDDWMPELWDLIICGREEGQRGLIKGLEVGVFSNILSLDDIACNFIHFECIFPYKFVSICCSVADGTIAIKLYKKIQKRDII